MDVVLVSVPYHLGHESVGMGAGPERLLDAGLVEALKRRGHEVEVERVELGPQANEVAAIFATAGLVAGNVTGAVERGAFPLVLSGNCFCSLGVVAGLGTKVGVVWLDAHADFNTAEETASGFADGMGLAVLTGTGWDVLRETVPGFRVVPERDVVLVGARDVDPGEEARLAASDVARIGARDAGSQLAPALAGLAVRVRGVYFHLDLDVLDPSEGRANEYAVPGGLRAADLAVAIETVGSTLPLRAAAVTAFDPALDPDGSLASTAIELAGAVADAATATEREQIPA